MDYKTIIDQYYPDDNELKRILLVHSRQVSDRCLKIAKQHPELKLDVEFLKEASMLHDIGIVKCNAPSIQCFGTEPYICHGMIGAQMLRSLNANGAHYNLERCALVCERHTGTGITVEQVIREELPIPERDYCPQSLEEKIICYADKFYSKSHLGEEVDINKIKYNIWKYGHEAILRWNELVELMGEAQRE